jgi:hypothetical protein
VKLNLVLIRQAPMSYLEDVVATIAGFWTPSAGQGLASLDSRILSLAWAGLDLAFIAGFFLLFVIVAGATALARVGRLIANRELSWPGPSYVRMRTVGYTLALGLVFYATMICGVAGPGLTRYRTPVMPLVIFAVFVGLDVCWRLRRRTR